MTDLLSIAERVEQARGADRELDERCFGVLFGWDWPLFGAAAQEYASVGSPSYTASLDAAMTLVPEGWGWLVSQPNAKAIASGLLKEQTPVMGEVQFGCDLRFTVAAGTPALALTAAALRARVSQEKSA